MKQRNPVAKHSRSCKGGAHTDRKKEQKRRPRRIPLWCSPLEWKQ